LQKLYAAAVQYFSLDPGRLADIPHRQAMCLTDLQVASLVWRHQMEEFTSHLDANSALASLDFKHLLADAVPMLKAVSPQFKLRLTDDQIAAAASEPVFRQNSRTSDEVYDPETRGQDEAVLDTANRETLNLMETWAKP